jgi:hypothetical protein
VTFLLLLPLWFMPVPTPEVVERPWRLAVDVSERRGPSAKLSRRQARRNRLA